MQISTLVTLVVSMIAVATPVAAGRCCTASPSGSPSASFDTELTVMVMARPISTATIQTTPDAAREVAGSLEVRMLETFSFNDFRGGGSDGEALV
ncbi:hypothetical protein E4U22_007694 [Claviceps purpurea]|nr:hypothetical protein E4U22_007694 [Claviceps purpurea]